MRGRYFGFGLLGSIIVLLMFSFVFCLFKTSYYSFRQIPEQQNSNLQITVSTPKYHYELNELLIIQIEAINLTNHTLEISFPSSYNFGCEILHNFQIVTIANGGGANLPAVQTYQIPVNGSKTWITNYQLKYPNFKPGAYIIHAWVVRYGHAYTIITVGSPMDIALNAVESLIFIQFKIQLISILLLGIILHIRHTKSTYFKEEQK